jgi:hypothetical protein
MDLVETAHLCRAMTTSSGNVKLERRSSLVQQVTHVSTDVTRRMVCGGLAGMIAKASDNERQCVFDMSMPCHAMPWICL